MVAIILIDIINSFSSIKKHQDYWLNHEINEIPENLIGKIDCLGDFKVINYPEDSKDPLNFKELLFKSKVIKGIFSPLIIYDELNVVPEKEDIHLILAGNNLNEAIELLKIKNLERDHTIENIKLWKVKEDLKLILIVTDNFLLLNLPPCEKHDFISYLMSETEESIKWGNELFNYYLSQAEEFKQI